jgi:hypothetical protein
MKPAQIIAIWTVVLFMGGCHRFNHAMINTSMSDAERYEVLQQTFFVGMPSAEVNERLIELRLAENHRSIEYKPGQEGERVATVVLRDRVYPVGIKGPGPGAPLSFVIDDESLLTRVTFARAAEQWSQVKKQPVHIISLNAYEPLQEPAP